MKCIWILNLSLSEPLKLANFKMSELSNQANESATGAQATGKSQSSGAPENEVSFELALFSRFVLICRLWVVVP